MIGKVYKLTDSRPHAFGEIARVDVHETWNEMLEEDEQVNLAWGDWYQWYKKEVYRIKDAGFEVERLVPATADEIEIYLEKVKLWEEIYER